MFTTTLAVFAGLLLAVPTAPSAPAVSPTSPVAHATATATAAVRVPGGRIKVVLTGARLGKSARVILRGLKGRAKGTKKSVRVKRIRVVRGLPAGRYRVAGKPITSAGRTATAQTVRVRITARRGAVARLAYRGSSDFLACMVSDPGGIDDRSFNASAYKGIQDAVAEYGIRKKLLKSKSQSDFARKINSLVKDDCGIIVTVGFLMEDATKDAAKVNPEERFAIVDAASNPKLENMKGLLFNTAESSFLAGYLAAGMTKTGKVATFGGLAIPSVTSFMDGYWEGVQYYNEQNGGNVEVLGWDQNKPDSGWFAGGFDDRAKGQQLAKKSIQQGADIILPVAGPVGLGAAKEAQSTGKADIIWVDSDGYESAPQYKDVFLTSVLKKIDIAVKETVGDAVNGEFTGTEYIGTLENDGTGLAPFHDFEDQVPQALKDQLTQVRQGIIDGSIEVTSPNQPGGGS